MPTRTSHLLSSQQVKTNRLLFPSCLRIQLLFCKIAFFEDCRSDRSTVECECEDGHSWPCDTYGRCDNDTNTCGCIRGFPKDGQLCQSIHHQSEFHSIFEMLNSLSHMMSPKKTVYYTKIFLHVCRQQVKHARPSSTTQQHPK